MLGSDEMPKNDEINIGLDFQTMYFLLFVRNMWGAVVGFFVSCFVGSFF